VEKYSTEIVADRMQLIGGARDAGTGGDAEFAGSGAGSGAPRRSGGATPATGGGGRKNADDFDDDIPF
jgi:single-strand DNA-binding protein